MKKWFAKIKDGAYVINLDEFKSIGTHWTALYVNGNNKRTSYDVVDFDSFGVEHIPKEIKKFIENKNIIRNIYRIQAYDSIMCGYFYIEFIDFMLKGKSLLDYTNLFSPNDYEKKVEIILKYFQQLKRWEEYITLFALSIENCKNLQKIISQKKH